MEYEGCLSSMEVLSEPRVGIELLEQLKHLLTAFTSYLDEKTYYSTTRETALFFPFLNFELFIL